MNKQVDDLPDHAINTLKMFQEVMGDCLGMNKSLAAKAFVDAYFEAKKIHGKS